MIFLHKLDSMLNIGKEIKMKLFSIGIRSSEDLIQLGSKQAFARLKDRYPNVCLVHLYAIQGAIDNIEYDKLSDETKLDLKQFCDSLK